MDGSRDTWRDIVRLYNLILISMSFYNWLTDRDFGCLDLFLKGLLGCRTGVESDDVSAGHHRRPQSLRIESTRQPRALEGARGDGMATWSRMNPLFLVSCVSSLSPSLRYPFTQRGITPLCRASPHLAAAAAAAAEDFGIDREHEATADDYTLYHQRPILEYEDLWQMIDKVWSHGKLHAVIFFSPHDQQNLCRFHIFYTDFPERH